MNSITMKSIAQYLITILLSAVTTVAIGYVIINTPALSRIIAQQLVQDANVATSSPKETVAISEAGFASFPYGAEFGTDNLLILDQDGNLTTDGIAKVGDLYVGGTAFIDSLNLADFLYVAGNKIIDATGRIPALTIDYIANLDGSAITGVNADKLDGVDSTGFIKTGTAIDADKLDGTDSSGFIKSGTAIDADKLDGVDSTSFLRSDAADTAGGALTFTAVPGSANVGGGSLYINPASSTANYTLFGVAVDGTEKFRVDAEGDTTIAGALTVTGGISGTINPGYTTGSVIFQGASGLAQDNTNFFWDDTNNRLGIGTNVPLTELDIAGSASSSGTLTFRGLTDPKLKILNGENLGIQMSAGGDSGLSEKVTITSAGRVGLGQTTPTEILDVSGNIKAERLISNVLRNTFSNSWLFTTDTNASNNTINLGLSGSTNTMTLDTKSGTGDILLNGDVGIGGTAAANMKLDVAGRVQLNLGGTQTSVALCGSHASAGGASVSDVEIVDCTGTPGADYMEMYPVETDADMGTVVAVGNNNITTKDGETIKQLVKSTSGYQSNLIGIVSDKSKAGDFNSIGYNIEDKDNPQPIALAGRVPVKVSNSSEAIQAGDFITSSTEAGKAMKATQAGYVIGKALESWSPNSGKGTVMIFVNNSYYIGGDSTLDSGSFLSLNSSQALSNSESLTGSTNQTIITELQTMEGLSFDEESKTLSATSIFKTIEEFVAEGIATFKNTVKFLADVTFGSKVNFQDEVTYSNKVVYEDKDAAGYAKIKSGSNEVKVNFENDYTYAPVVQVTPQGNYDVKYWVTDVSTKGFTIKIDPSLSEEVQFSWSALAVKDAKTYEGSESSVTPEPTAPPSPSPTEAPIEESTSSAEVDTPTTEPAIISG